MTDNEIKEILIERKKMQRRHERIHKAKTAAWELIGWISLIVICFMLSGL